MPAQSRLIPLIIASALFIATALPAIAADLGTDPIILKLAFTTYLLSLTVFIPVSGWCADRFGARNVFRAAIAVFTLGSIACGLAETLAGLVAARALQGVGGAMMVPVGRIILLRAVPKSELVDALAWLTIPALVGPLVGPPIGGYITTYVDWRWIFWMNAPFGVAAIAFATLRMPDYEAEHVPPLDVKGFLLSGVGLSLTVFGLTVAGREVVSVALPYLIAAAGAVFLAAYALHARRVADPILDFRLLRIDTFRAGVLGGSLFRIGVGAVPFLLPLMFQLGFGLSAFETGTITFAAAAGAIAIKFAAAAAIRRYGFRRLLLANGLMAGLSIAVMGFLTAATPLLVTMAVLFVGGFLRSLQFTAMHAVSYADMDHARMSHAASLYTVAQQLSLSLGVVLAAFVLETAQWWRNAAALQPADFTVAFLIVAAVSLTALHEFRALAADAGSSVSGRGGGS
jgi:EmrB/QacA subfamily drug resistance transporter